MSRPPLISSRAYHDPVIVTFLPLVLVFLSRVQKDENRVCLHHHCVPAVCRSGPARSQLSKALKMGRSERSRSNPSLRPFHHSQALWLPRLLSCSYFTRPEGLVSICSALCLSALHLLAELVCIRGAGLLSSSASSHKPLTSPPVNREKCKWARKEGLIFLPRIPQTHLRLLSFPPPCMLRRNINVSLDECAVLTRGEKWKKMEMEKKWKKKKL